MAEKTLAKKIYSQKKTETIVFAEKINLHNKKLLRYWKIIDSLIGMINVVPCSGYNTCTSTQYLQQRLSKSRECGTLHTRNPQWSTVYNMIT